MSSLYKAFGSDEKLVAEGSWVTVELGEETLQPPRFKLGYMSDVSNPKYAACVERHAKPHRRQLLAGNLSARKQKKIHIDTFAESILLDWQHVYDQHDKPLPFSVEAAKILLTDLPELYSILVGEAMDIANFQASVEEEDLGNSKGGSGGTAKSPTQAA